MKNVFYFLIQLSGVCVAFKTMNLNATINSKNNQNGFNNDLIKMFSGRRFLQYNNFPPPPPQDCQIRRDPQGCSVPCGGGTETIVTVVIQYPKNGGIACPDLTNRTETCNTNPCPVPTGQPTSNPTFNKIAKVVPLFGNSIAFCEIKNNHFRNINNIVSFMKKSNNNIEY